MFRSSLLHLSHSSRNPISVDLDRNGDDGCDSTNVAAQSDSDSHGSNIFCVTSKRSPPTSSPRSFASAAFPTAPDSSSSQGSHFVRSQSNGQVSAVTKTQLLLSSHSSQTSDSSQPAVIPSRSRTPLQSQRVDAVDHAVSSPPHHINSPSDGSSSISGRYQLFSPPVALAANVFLLSHGIFASACRVSRSSTRLVASLIPSTSEVGAPTSDVTGGSKRSFDCFVSDKQQQERSASAPASKRISRVAPSAAAAAPSLTVGGHPTGPCTPTKIASSSSPSLAAAAVGDGSPDLSFLHGAKYFLPCYSLVIRPPF